MCDDMIVDPVPLMHVPLQFFVGIHLAQSVYSWRLMINAKGLSCVCTCTLQPSEQIVEP